MSLFINNISCGYRKKVILENIDVIVGKGEILCILGPNGVGKTTFFKTLLGLIPVLKGSFFIDDKNMRDMRRSEIAKIIAYVPQSHTFPYPFTVKEVIVMGRTAHLGILDSPSKRDYIVTDEVMRNLNIFHLRNEVFTRISGGERQMVMIARALAQEPKFLMMHEPTSNLDYRNQVQVLLQIKALAETGISIIMTSHIPDHGFMCSTKVLLMEKYKYRIGDADEVITEENLRSAYGISVFISKAVIPMGGEVKSCIPIMSNKRR